MIRFYNRSLFTETEKEGKTTAKGSYDLTVFATSVPATDQNGETSYKQFASVRHDQGCAINDADSKTRIKFPMPNQNGGKMPNGIQVNQSKSFPADTDVFFFAIPFRGIMEPIAKSYDYRIYKGFILKTEKNAIVLDDKKYNRAAYFMFSINSKLFEEDSKYHKDQIEMIINTYKILKDRDKETESTQKVSFKFIFKKNEDGSIDYDCETSEEPSEGIDMDSYKGTPLFPIFVPVEKSDNNKEGGKTYNKNRQDRPYNKDKNNGEKKNQPSGHNDVNASAPDGATFKKDTRKKNFQKKENFSGEMKRPKNKPYNKEGKNRRFDETSGDDYDRSSNDGGNSSDDDDNVGILPNKDYVPFKGNTIKIPENIVFQNEDE